MDKDLFNFELVDKYPPEVVIKHELEQIEEATKGYVVGHIEEYHGEVTSYKKRTGLAALENFLVEQGETIEVDIQEDLGEIYNEKHRYEVFLTVKGLDYYKYRMMFVDYGAISYPVTIVMNEVLAMEYSKKRKLVFCIESMQSLENMLKKVINSNTMISLIQSLIGEALRQENIAETSLESEGNCI